MVPAGPPACYNALEETTPRAGLPREPLNGEFGVQRNGNYPGKKIPWSRRGPPACYNAPKGTTPRAGLPREPLSGEYGVQNNVTNQGKKYPWSGRDPLHVLVH